LDSNGRKICEKILYHLCEGPQEGSQVRAYLELGEDEFQILVQRLIDEGYLERSSTGSLKFVAPVLADWWKIQKGLRA